MINQLTWRFQSGVTIYSDERSVKTTECPKSKVPTPDLIEENTFISDPVRLLE